MVALKNILKKMIIMTILISILISFSAIPASYAKLDIKSGEFYYSGTQKGQYVAKSGVFDWLVETLSDVAAWIFAAIATAIRAPFIGWTALIERLLTGALEATAGIDMNNNISNTDLDSIIHSEKNVTVQAIVYNQVPALDVNFFNTEYNKEYSPTGTPLICSKCQKECKECAGTEKNCNGDCKCGPCESCQTYAKLNESEPLFIQFKETISFWYYTIRFIALIGMLVLLVAIGIKMAINNVASQKATYKRMITDWVIGILIIFLLHYAMYFTIYINDILVKTVRESAKKVNTVKMMELAEKSTDNSEGITYSNTELEIDIYEEVRTRAYDAKFVNGLIGTILYMSLVYLAIRYTLMYLKRLFIVAILMLMGPGVGFAYAFQKAMSGKSMAIKKWLSEFIINVIIQTFHAIIYAVFISTVLVLSLKSISGVIVAFIMMNFTLKAEEIFRKIFNLDKSSLLKETDKAGNIEERAKEIAGTYKGVKAVAKNIGDSFYGSAVKGVAKAVVGGAVIATAGTVGFIADNKVEDESDDDSDNGDSDISVDDMIDSLDDETEASFMEKVPLIGNTVANRRKDEVLSNIPLEKLAEVFEKAKEEYENNPNDQDAKNNYIKAYNNLARKYELNSVSTKDAVIGHIKNLFDRDNYYKVKFDKNGKKHYVLKGSAIFGTSHYDVSSGKYVSDKNSAIRQLGASKLFGFTSDDFKVFKENVWNPLSKGLLGTASMFAGLSVMAVHPEWGMGLLALGAPNKYGSFAKLGYIPTLNNSKRYKERRYNFVAFSTPTLKRIKDETIKRMKEEQSALNVQRIRDRHPVLFNSIRAGTIGVATLVAGIGGGIVTKTVFSKYDHYLANKDKRIDNKVDKQGRTKIYNIEDNIRFKTVNTSEAEDAINKHHLKQFKKQQKEFQKDALDMIARENEINTQIGMQKIYKQVEKESYDSLGFKYDKKTKELYDVKIVTQDPDLNSSGSTGASPKDDAYIPIGELQDEVNGNKITDVDNRNINNLIDIILCKLVGNGLLDINSEARINQIIKILNAELVKAHILLPNQSVEDIFKNGRNGLKKAIKKKAKKVNDRIEKEKEIFKRLNSSESNYIKDAIENAINAEVAKRSKSKKKKKRSVYDSINKDQVLDEVIKKVSDELYIDEDNRQVNRNPRRVVNRPINPAITDAKKRRYKIAIKEYLEFRKDDNNNAPTRIEKRVFGKEKKDGLKSAEEKATARKNKLKQTYEVFLDDPEEGLRILKTDEDLKGLNSSKVLEQLLVMKSLNAEGKKLKVKGSSGYKIKSNKKNEAQSKYYRALKDVIQDEMDYKLPRDYETKYKNPEYYDSLSSGEKVRIGEVIKKKQKVREYEEIYRELEKKAKKSGPVVDILKVIDSA